MCENKMLAKWIQEDLWFPYSLSCRKGVNAPMMNPWGSKIYLIYPLKANTYCAKNGARLQRCEAVTLSQLCEHSYSESAWQKDLLFGMLEPSVSS